MCLSKLLSSVEMPSPSMGEVNLKCAPPLQAPTVPPQVIGNGDALMPMAEQNRNNPSAQIVYSPAGGTHPRGMT